MLITKCPHCQTTFRVRSEQLHLRGGRVRCGTCQTPFSALQSLEELPDAAAITVVTNQPVASTPSDLIAPIVVETSREMRLDEEESEEAADKDAQGEPLKFDIEFDPAKTELNEAAITAPVEPLPAEEPSFAEQDSRSVAERIEQAMQEENLVETLTAQELDDADAPEDDLLADDENTDDGLDGVPQLHTIFLEEDAQQLAQLDANAKAHQRHTRYKLWAASVVLTLSGLLMSAYILRVELARLYPQTRAKLEAACAQIGCDVPYPRDLDLIDRSGVELSPQPGVAGGYILAITLRNTARYPIAWPQLDLALTDRYDRSLTRRVLDPQEWLPKAYASQPAFEAQGELTAHILLASTSDVMGYRVGPFYR